MKASQEELNTSCGWGPDSIWSNMKTIQHFHVPRVISGVPAVMGSPATVPLGLSDFSIWGNGGTPTWSHGGNTSGPNGFLGSGLFSAAPRSGISERDMAAAKEAGYFCPLTKAVLANPVVASDG